MIDLSYYRELTNISDWTTHLEQLSPLELSALEKAVTPKMTKYIPHQPYAKQAAFLLLTCKEAFYGGAAGGGKSDALLMGALQYVDVPGYSALLLRKTYSDLTLPGALLPRAREWLAPYVESGEVKWNDKDRTYYFPTGGAPATITFGYLEHPKDKYRYQSAEFQFVGVDELTQIDRESYRYMFSRVRRLKGSKVPIRVRSASNPGNDGHEWVQQRFMVEGPSKGRIFIPAKMTDNPYLDQEEYDQALQELDPVTRAQLRDGNWSVKRAGNMFKRAWFTNIITRDQLPKYVRTVRYWDLAASEVKPGKNPDWTTGLLLGEYRGTYFIIDVRRVRAKPYDVEQLIRATAEMDTKKVPIYIEQEPGSAGIHLIDTYARGVLQGYAVRPNRATGSKVIRANPVSSAAEGGRVSLVRGPWLEDLLDELEAFPRANRKDDQVDALSGAFSVIKSSPNILSLPSDVGDDVESYWSSM